jgi:NAD(P)-dependent dehydrogenase (short-subunit alcohol dehydrogenase family)
VTPLPQLNSGERPVALITGSSRGIGRATALLFAQRGHDVVVHYRREADAAEATAKEVREAGADALVVQGDLSDGDVPERILAGTAERFGRLDVLVANAAATAFKPLLDVGAKHLDLTMRTVVQSFLLLAQGAVPLMSGRPGAIVAVSGFDSIRVVANHGLLATSPSTASSPEWSPPTPPGCGPTRAIRAAGRHSPLNAMRTRSSPPSRSPRSSPSSAPPPAAASAATT